MNRKEAAETMTPLFLLVAAVICYAFGLIFTAPLMYVVGGGLTFVSIAWVWVQDERLRRRK